MRKTWRILLCFAGLWLPARAQTRWQQELHYRIDATLDDRANTLDAVMRLQYVNHSPDTLRFLWFLLWPNAFRNDRTAYTEQALGNGDLDFYFSSAAQKGYVNRLEFRVNDTIARLDDAPEDQDVGKLVLPGPLAPGATASLSISFHEQLPLDFAGLGYRGRRYRLTNWYPEPAVYDSAGWHPMPFLRQGGGYHEIASYDVSLTLPRRFRVGSGAGRAVSVDSTQGPNTVWHFRDEAANGFSWIAGRDLVALHGNTDNVTLFHFAGEKIPWAARVAELDAAAAAIRREFPALGAKPLALAWMPPDFPAAPPLGGLGFLSGLHGNRPGQTARAAWRVAMANANEPDERRYPFLRRGLAEFLAEQSAAPSANSAVRRRRIELEGAVRDRTDQPITTPGPQFSDRNYDLIAVQKSADWFASLRDSLGEPAFQDRLRNYFSSTAGTHPFPADLENALRGAAPAVAGRRFRALDAPGPVTSDLVRRRITLRWPFVAGRAARDPSQVIYASPVPGYNLYEGVMGGIGLTNYGPAPGRFRFYATALLGGSGKPTGLAGVNYTFFPQGNLKKITVGLNGARFTTNSAYDSTGRFLYAGVRKLVPWLRLEWKNEDPRSLHYRWLDARSFLLRETSLAGFAFASNDISYPAFTSTGNRYVNQVTFATGDTRKLYPYGAMLQAQQTDKFYRVNLTLRYFLNYGTAGGLQARFFAAKFGTWRDESGVDLTPYMPKLLGNTGDDDYTYENYFVGRGATSALGPSSITNADIPGRQIMIRDGGLKLRIDEHDVLGEGSLTGRSADWVAAINLTSTLPAHWFPVPLPVRFFFDAGTYAEAWKADPPTSRFLYVGGVQLTLFRDVLNIYAPLVYSPDFRDALRGPGGGTGFLRRMTFSIDLGAWESNRPAAKIPEP